VLGTKGKGKGKPVADSSLRDTENVPLREDVQTYFVREVLPHAPDQHAATPQSGQYCVYVLECADGSFYKGQTSDFPKRMEEHEKGQVSWTAKHLPVKPIHWEILDTRESAVSREQFLKSGKGREWLQAKYREKKLKSFERQAGAWIDETKTKVGYEIPFNRHFYVFKAPRPLEEIDANLKECTDRILTMIEGLSQ
jgi:predicted GIY-YIG superfamily endonuclease